MVQILSTRGRAPKELLGVGAELGGVATRNRIAPETVTVLAPALGDTELYQHGAEATDVGLPTFTHDTSSHRYARIEVRVTEAGASGAVLQLQYRRRSVGGDFLPAGGPLGAVEASLAAVGDVIGGSVPLTAQCTGDCEFRVVPAGGDGAASPCIENLYVKFMDVPMPANTAPMTCITWDDMSYADVPALEAVHPETDNGSGTSRTWSMVTSPRNAARLVTDAYSGDVYRTATVTGLVPGRQYEARMWCWQYAEGPGGIVVGIRSGGAHHWYEEAMGVASGPPGMTVFEEWTLLAIPVTADVNGEVTVEWGQFGASSDSTRDMMFGALLMCGGGLAPPPDPDPDGCNSGLTGTALYGEDFCGFESKSEVVSYYGEGAPHGTHPVFGGDLSAGLTWTEGGTDVAPWTLVTDHPWNGGHTARRLTLPASSGDRVFMHGLRVFYEDEVDSGDRLTDVWVRVRFTVPPDYDDAGGDNAIYLLNVNGSISEGPRFQISRSEQTFRFGAGGDLELIVTNSTGFGSGTPYALGAVSDLFAGGGVHELVVHMARESTADYRCRAWIGEAGGDSHTQVANFAQTIAFTTPFTLASLETMECYWSALPGTAHVIEHLETEVSGGADPFGVDS